MCSVECTCYLHFLLLLGRISINFADPAKVTFTPTVQYLPFRLAGVVQCYIKSNPPLQYVTWTKDKRLLEPYQTKDIVIMNNGSLLFTRVNQNHQGRYTCTPYNAQGTQGSSGAMEVLVRKPPMFTIEPDALYQRKVGESVEMHCDAQEAEGTQRPNISWFRRGKCKFQFCLSCIDLIWFRFGVAFFQMAFRCIKIASKHRVAILRSKRCFDPILVFTNAL